MSVRQLLQYIRDQLADAGITEASVEGFIILEWTCGIDRVAYYMDPDQPVPEEKKAGLPEVLEKRKKRVPLQYIMRSCEFMGYPFYVDERVLIPRQDTECLVEQVVDGIRKAADQTAQAAGMEPGLIDAVTAGTGDMIYTGASQESPARPDYPKKTDSMNIGDISRTGDKSGRKVRLLDMCTGSGCIGISIGKMCPNTEITLSDLSADALSVAALNADRLQVPVELIQGDLFEHVQGNYDYIVSNPPYISSREIDRLMPEVRDYEPHMALDGSEDGLAFYRRIIHEAKDYLLPGGRLFFEIGMDQGEALKSLLGSEGYQDIEIRQDLAGLDRIASGCLVSLACLTETGR